MAVSPSLRALGFLLSLAHLALCAPTNDTVLDAGSLFERQFTGMLPAPGISPKQGGVFGLFKRDVCTNTFGSGYVTNICTPGNTLCCVNYNQNLPQCVQEIGIGWCCTQDGGCYTDVPSACGQPGAVSCTQLAAGVSRACCPQNTFCVPGYNATVSILRCGIEQTALEALASSTSSISGATPASPTAPPATTSILTAVPGGATTSSSTSSLPSPSSSSLPSSSGASNSSGGLSAGAAAGIAIGAVAAVALVAAAVWFCWRKKRNSASPQDTGSAAMGVQQTPYSDKPVGQGEYTQPPQTEYNDAKKSNFAELQGANGSGYAAELPAGGHGPAELPSERA